jgi:hypothetical protein
MFCYNNLFKPIAMDGSQQKKNTKILHIRNAMGCEDGV